MTRDLFENLSNIEPDETLEPGARVLRGFAKSRAELLLAAIRDITARAPFRFLVTPGGYRMSVAMTGCGDTGWVSDRRGYRYDAIDPLTGLPWPPMPAVFEEVAAEAAAAAGFDNYRADAVLINRYEPGARLTLHQDKTERDLVSPVVSVSLGLPAVFLYGGENRSDRTRRVPLSHGDVVVWGGPARLRYHGVLPLKDGDHSVLGRQRLNITFRKVF